MKNLKQHKHLKILSLFTILLLFINCDNDDDNISQQPWESEVALLKAAIQQYKDFDTAENAGYNIKATEYREQMGYHYLNAGLLDGKFEIEKPEVLIFVNGPSGKLQLVAVEYGIPITDLNNPPPAPDGYTGNDDVWKVDTEFSLWTLHVWIELENPNGIFTARNPVLP